MISSQESETPPLEHSKTEYLARLSEVDRQNIEKIVELFPQVMSEQGRAGSLLAVGGTISKPLPRKDIDLIILMQKNPDGPKKDDYPDYYQYFVAKFRIFQKVLEGIVAKAPSLQITAVLDPQIDGVFQSPGILHFDGSVKMTNSKTGGTPLEFLREDLDQFPHTRGLQKGKPFVILSNTPTPEVK